MINVSEIKKGIVLDHICQGQGYEIFKVLHLHEVEDVVVLLQSIPSEKLGRKDLIKIETDLPLDLTVLGLMGPGITVNYIEEGERVHKKKLSLPRSVEGILSCKNPRCITLAEKIHQGSFYLAKEEMKLYRCGYCDAAVSL